jgi:choline-sulfatase
MYPTIIDSFSLPVAKGLTGESLFKIMANSPRDRTVFAEYHGVGSKNAMYMLRNSRYKYIYHVDAVPQLFDFDTDANEEYDLAGNPESRNLVSAFEKQLREILDPEAVDKEAKQEQKKKIELAGGEEAVKRRGTFDNTPIPGEKPVFFKRE